MIVFILCKVGKKNVFLMKDDNSWDGYVENMYGILKKGKKKRGLGFWIKIFFFLWFLEGSER